jgi:hypothetical protein
MKFIKMSLAGLILSVSCFTNVSHAGLITDPLEDKIVTVGNLDWAWASPCSGGCSQLVDDWEYAGGVYTDLLNTQLEVSTWRFASVSEWALLPSAASFRNDNKCAAAWFDNRHSHCDYGDPTSRIPVGGYSETFVVRTNSVVNAVPEPSTLVVFALGMIGLVSRRFKKQS